MTKGKQLARVNRWHLYDVVSHNYILFWKDMDCLWVFCGDISVPMSSDFQRYKSYILSASAQSLNTCGDLLWLFWHNHYFGKLAIYFTSVHCAALDSTCVFFFCCKFCTCTIRTIALAAAGTSNVNVMCVTRTHNPRELLGRASVRYTGQQLHVAPPTSPHPQFLQ